MELGYHLYFKKLTFFVGVKNDDDYLLQSEIKYFQDEGIIGDVHVAKSRNPVDGVKYVQDFVPKFKNKLQKLGEGDAWLVGCGSKTMGKGLREKLSEIGVDLSKAPVAMSCSAGRKKGISVPGEVSVGGIGAAVKNGLYSFMRGLGFAGALGLPSLFLSKHSSLQKDFKVLENADKALDQGAEKTDQVINAVLAKLGIEEGQYARQLRKIMSNMDSKIEEELGRITKSYVTKVDLAVFLALSFGLGYGYVAALLWAGAGHAANYLVLDRSYEIARNKYNGESIYSSLQKQRLKFLRDFKQARRDWTEEEIKKSGEELLEFATKTAKDAGNLLLEAKKIFSRQNISKKSYELLSKINLFDVIEKLLESGEEDLTQNIELTVAAEDGGDILENATYKEALAEVDKADKAIAKITAVKLKLQTLLESDEVKADIKLKQELEKLIEEFVAKIIHLEEVAVASVADNDNVSLGDWLKSHNPSETETTILHSKRYEASISLKSNADDYIEEINSYFKKEPYRKFEEQYKEDAANIGNKYYTPKPQEVLKIMKEADSSLAEDETFKAYEKAKLFQAELKGLSSYVGLKKDI